MPNLLFSLDMMSSTPNYRVTCRRTNVEKAPLQEIESQITWPTTGTHAGANWDTTHTTHTIIPPRRAHRADTSLPDS